MKQTLSLVAGMLLLAGCSNLEMQMPPTPDPEVTLSATRVPDADAPSFCRQVTISLSQLGRTHSVTVTLLVDDGIGVEDPAAPGSFIAKNHAGISLECEETLPYGSATYMLEGCTVEADLHYDYFADLASQTQERATTSVVLDGPCACYPAPADGCAPYSYDLGSCDLVADAQPGTGAREAAAGRYDYMFCYVGLAEIRLRNQAGTVYFTWKNPAL